MTTTIRNDEPEILHASEAEIRRAVQRALRNGGGYTYDELHDFARHDAFPTRKAREAWVSVRDLRSHAV